MSVIPEIDLSTFIRGDAGDRRSVARETDAVCRDIGFLCVTGHGVPQSVNTAIYDCAKRFFRQPLDQKAAVRQRAPEVIRGYIGFGRAALAATRGDRTPPDLKETYSIGPEWDDIPAAVADDPAGAACHAANIWPEGDPDFRRTFADYYAAMDRLSRDIMGLFAVALDLPEDHFVGAIDRHVSILSAMYYPDQPVPPEPGQLRAGAHSDFGTMTILRPDSAPGGLQVLTKAGTWAAAKAPPGAYILNIGDLMARWTNDRWVSTLHRVVNPPGDPAGSAERLSIGFFHQPNHDAVVECLPGCRDPILGAKYPPVTAGSHQQTQFGVQVLAADGTA